jgi:transposase
MISSKDIRERLKDIDDFLLEEYRRSHPGDEKRDWRTYEQRLTARVRYAIRNLDPLIDEAVSTLRVERGKGRRPELSLKQRVILILVKELFDRSNRNMEAMLDLFSLLTNIEVSYKSIERLYSDPEVELALHNLHVLIMKRKGVSSVDASGDGTGYSLQISKHYASEAQKRKSDAKEADEGAKKKKRAFAYSFKLLDLNTNLYAAYGLSFKSEKEAYDRAMAMFRQLVLKLESIRLDRLYSCQSYVDELGDTKVYIIPKKNATVKGSWIWKQRMRDFVQNTRQYLKEYYRREHSEAEFSADKRWFGWQVAQRRDDRIETAVTCANLWHNLFSLYPA